MAIKKGEVQILAYTQARKTKKLLDYIPLAENYFLSVGNKLVQNAIGWR